MQHPSVKVDAGKLGIADVIIRDDSAHAAVVKFVLNGIGYRSGYVAGDINANNQFRMKHTGVDCDDWLRSATDAARRVVLEELTKAIESQITPAAMEAAREVERLRTIERKRKEIEELYGKIRKLNNEIEELATGQ